MYKLDIDKYQDPSTFSIYSDITVKDIADDIIKFKEKYPKYRDYGSKVFIDAANNHYEYTFMDDYVKEIRSDIEYKIEKDINILNEFYNQEGDVTHQGDIKVTEINWGNDTIEFEGKECIDKLASIIVNVINDYGVFNYEALEDFYEATADNRTSKGKIEAIQSHLHWLNYFEDIYGTIHNVCYYEPDLKTDYMGNFKFTKEDVDYIID